VSRKADPIFVLFFVSGFGGLIYESVWSHYVKLFLGHAAYAQTLVLVVFIGGLALGSWLCARVAERLANPLRIYAAIELGVGLAALAFHSVFQAAIDWGYSTLLPAACEQASTFCAAQWGLAAILLLPQSVLLGATFPLVSSAVLRLQGDQPGHDISALYFLNSLGAVLGVLASAFVLIPAVGLPGTLMTAGVANILLAVAAYALSKSPPPPLAVAAAPVEAGAVPEPAGRIVRVLLAVAFLTGLSSFIYEIAWIRMLSLVLGSSTHSFELMLSSFILGLALGGYWVRNRVDAVEDPVRLLAIVQLVMGVAAAATIPVYNGAFDLMAWLLSALARSDAGFVLFNLSSSAICLAVMLPATLCAGMTLPLITFRLLRSSAGERSLGLVYAVNTLGAIMGVIIAVHLLMEALGVRGALLVGAVIDVALGAALLAYGARDRLRAVLQPATVAAAVALLAITIAFPLDPRRTSSGVFRSGAAVIPTSHSIAFHRDGKTATVDVLESQGGTRAIRTNGKSDAALALKADAAPTGDEFTMTLLGLLPMGHRPEAKTAAVIGFGSGLSTTVLLTSPALERVDTVEIEPAMVEGARLFRPIVDAAYDDPRSRIVIDDAKSYFARGRNRYDIIVSEPSNPWVSGVAALFTEEFYARLATYLNDGGVLSQWLHTYEMDAQTLASILAALSKTFPEYVVYSSIDTDLIVVARKGGVPGRFREEVLDWPKLKPLVAKLKFEDVDNIHRRSVARWSTLKPLFASYQMPANSDYFPIVDQRASKTRFTQTKVSELVELQAAVVPLLAMVDGRALPSARRGVSIPTTFVDAAAAESWLLHDLVLGTGAPPAAGVEVNAREAAARLLRAWATSCPKDLGFDNVRLAMVSVAEMVNPHLHPDVSARIWRFLADSPCAKGLAAQDRRWLELLEAVSRREAKGMALAGTALLESGPAAKNAATEYAFFAAMTGLVCTGDRAARPYLEDGVWKWVRPGTRRTEIRFLDVLTGPQGSAMSGAPCRAPAAA
jgi:spermidine synthase